jgi:hypothetical protein
MLSDHQSRFVQARAFTTDAHAGQPHTDAILLTITGNPHASVVDHSITSMLQPTALPNQSDTSSSLSGKIALWRLQTPRLPA